MAASAADLNEDQSRLFDSIRRWRAEQAELAGVPRYVVLTNRDIEALVRHRPDSAAALQRLPGIGKAKITRYGEALLELLHPSRSAPRLVPDGQPATANADLEEAAKP